jgi:glycosyltransferase involved in cell wall biosynthesis
MKILIIAQYFYPDFGGASTRAYNVAKGLVNLGNAVKVVTAFPHYPHGRVPSRYKRKAVMFEDMDEIEIIRVWIPSLPHDSVVKRIIIHVCFVISSLFALPFLGEVDVVFAANPNLFSFFPALVYSFVKLSPIVRNVDDLWPEVFYDMNLVKSNALKKLLDFVAWLSYSVPVAITPISAGYKRRIMEKYGVREEKIRVIEVGVDTSVFSKSILNKKDDFVVMYSGVLGQAYDFRNVLFAAKLLSDFKEIRFFIRGIGECERDIREMIEEFSLGNVMLDTSLVSKLKLVEILNLADIFLLPMKEIQTADEGLPTKIFEYQAMGKPIVCSSRGEPARYIKFTRSGVVVDPGNPKALADVISTLYKDENLIWELGENGQKYVRDNLSVGKIGERMYKVFMCG